MKPDETADELQPDPSSGPTDDLQPDDLKIPYPAPSDVGGAARGYTIEIFGDERGGQTPAPPPKTTDDF